MYKNWEKIAEKYALMFELWSEQYMNDIGVFAVYLSKGALGYKRALLSFSPLLNEQRLGADKHVTFITTALSCVQKEFSGNVAIIGDHCNTKKAKSDKLGLHLTVCASHRFKLAVQDIIKCYDPILTKVQSIMKQLMIKNGAAPRTLTNLRRSFKTETRWSSRFAMLVPFQELKEDLQHFGVDKIDTPLPDAVE